MVVEIHQVVIPDVLLLLRENGNKDPWEVVRMAKNPRGRKERTKMLKRLEGEEISEAQ